LVSLSRIFGLLDLLIVLSSRMIFQEKISDQNLMYAKKNHSWKGSKGKKKIGKNCINQVLARIA
jgi:hypothetical protein